jgi:hypothetical protein
MHSFLRKTKSKREERDSAGQPAWLPAKMLVLTLFQCLDQKIHDPYEQNKNHTNAEDVYIIQL